jgi:tRNA-(ms[2]io[6]A)-hydroxylase
VGGVNTPLRPAIEGFPLLAPTPTSWVDYAVAHPGELLVDHANCEKKAASTALALMFAYPEDRKLTGALSRLAREELRHFEQVQRMMETLNVPYLRQKPGRYGAGLRAVMRTADPGRKLDLLLIGALIEARSAERFRLLAPRLPEPLADFYATLERSEARHFELYLGLAHEMDSSKDGVESARRLSAIAAKEAELATAPDDAFRFHSGAPTQTVAQ